RAIQKADIIYLLRIQKERHNDTDNQYYRGYPQNYGLNLEKLEKINRLIPIFHPGPANIGMEIDHRLLKSELYAGYKQVENSVYMRMAIIKAMLASPEK
ncbi:MAG: hypothetical protein OXB84_00980, partial [Halobacteriovoraceae bacterium]|nr:hypothetical protein [Halobacteriovoraceae bacterium]